MEKILFILPPGIRFNDFVHPTLEAKCSLKNGRAYGYVITGMPLGILSLSAYVKKHSNLEAKLLDFNVALNKLDKFEYKSFVDFFRETMSLPQYVNFNPSIIGISSLFTTSYQSSLEIIRLCHDIFGDAIVICGGGAAQNLHKHMFNEIPKLHSICYGEGEKPLLRLLTATDKQSYLEDSPSWITQSKVEHAQFEYDFIEDLDEIPIYDYELLNVEDYSISPGYDKRSGFTDNYSVMTSRGCIFKCTFCASSSVHGRKVRSYSVNRVREDFMLLKEKYGAKTLIFQDDYLMFNKERVYKIINIMKEEGLTAVIQAGLNLYSLDRGILKALSEIGVRHLTLPVESGSQRVLTKIMKKQLKLEQVKRVVDDCRTLGIYSNLNIILGMPGETKKDIEETIAFLKELKANWIGFVSATPLPGSELLNVCLENDYLCGNYIESDYKKAIIKTKDFTPEHINKTVYSMNLEINFCSNADFNMGEYETALIGFKNTLKSNSDHAFAYYYSGKCHEKLGNPEKAQKYFATASKIINKHTFWSDYADKFNITIPLEQYVQSLSLSN